LKSHVRPEHPADLDYRVAVVDEREVEKGGERAHLHHGIFQRQDTALHRGVLRPGSKEVFDGGQVVRTDEQIVVEADDNLPARGRNRAILDTALAPARLMQVGKRDTAPDQRGRGRTVFCDKQLVAIGLELVAQAANQAVERVRADVGRDNDRKLQGTVNDFVVHTALAQEAILSRPA